MNKLIPIGTRSLEDTCEWKYDDDGEWDTYESSCGGEFQFMNDGIKENGFVYCPYCGGQIIPVINGEAGI